MKRFRRISLKKDNGIADAFTGIVPIFFAIFFVMIFTTISIFIVQKEKVQDELIMASLGALQPDAMEYGRTGRIIITDTGNAFAAFQEILKHNMSLNSDFTPKDFTFIAGPVQIETFIIYNNEIGKFTAHNLTAHTTEVISGNTAITPNGKTIDRTSVYVKISFPYKLFGETETAVIDNVTAIKTK